MSLIDGRADPSNQFGSNFSSDIFQPYSTGFSISKCCFKPLAQPYEKKLTLNIFICSDCSSGGKSSVSAKFFFFPFVTNSIAHLLSPGDFSPFHLLQTTCRVKAFTSALLAFLEDKEFINFVGDG